MFLLIRAFFAQAISKDSIIEKGGGSLWRFPGQWSEHVQTFNGKTYSMVYDPVVSRRRLNKVNCTLILMVTMVTNYKISQNS